MIKIKPTHSDQIVVSSHQLDDQYQHLRSQRTGMLLGTLFYPTIALITRVPYVAMGSLFCVGTHFISSRLAYLAAQQELILGAKISNDEKLDQTIRSQISKGEISRFYFDINGKLIFLTNPSGFSSLKGMPLYPVQNKSQKHIPDSIDFYSQRIFEDQISKFHLDDETRTQVDRIMQARSLRFRAGISFIAATGILSKIVYGNFITGAFVGGFTHLATLPSYRVHVYTYLFWQYLSKKENLQEIVQPRYHEYYPHMFEKGKSGSLNITMFGNIRFSDKPSFFNACRYSVESKNL